MKVVAVKCLRALDTSDGVLMLRTTPNAESVRYNIVSLKNVLDAGTKLDAWQKGRKSTRNKRSKSPQADVVPMIRGKSLVRSKSAQTA
jgi:hypothetical protein